MEVFKKNVSYQLNIILVHTLYFHVRFKLQGNYTYAGATVNEVYNNLLILGNVFTMYAEDMNFNALNRLHSALIKIYGGIYPLEDIYKTVFYYNSILNYLFCLIII